MIKKVISALVLMSCLILTSCNQGEKIYEGDFSIHRPMGLLLFFASNVTTITGYLIISYEGEAAPPVMTNLTGLEKLTHIGGDLSISGNPRLIDL